MVQVDFLDHLDMRFSLYHLEVQITIQHLVTYQIIKQLEKHLLRVRVYPFQAEILIRPQIQIFMGQPEKLQVDFLMQR